MKRNVLLIAILFFQLCASAQKVVSTNGSKYVLIEQRTGAKVGYAPDGYIYLENILASRPKVIGVNHHSWNPDDGMANTESTLLITSFSSIGAPSAFIDRKKFSSESSVSTSRNTWDAYAAILLQNNPDFDVKLTYSYNASTRTISARVSGKALAGVLGIYTTNLYIMEDSVSGTGNLYDQLNYYNTAPGHPYFGLGNPITGFKHTRVVRDMLSSTWGASVFLDPAVNDTGGTNYQYTIPAGYDVSKMYLVATIAKHNPSNINDNEIQNAIESPKDLGCSYVTPTAAICAVTTDPQTGNNIVAWDGTGIQHAKTYKIYRENAGTYQLLTSQAANLNTSYADISATPQLQSYSYKITVMDSCGGESAIATASPHTTFHLAFDVLTGNTAKLSWTAYTGTTFSGMKMMRSTDGGPFTAIGTIPSGATSFDDANPPAGVNRYMLEAQLPTVCNTGGTNYPVVNSNIVNGWKTGVNGLQLNSDLQIYPNPAKNVVTLSSSSIDIKTIEISDLMGQKLRSQSVEGKKVIIDMTEFASGIYIIKVNDSYVNKVIKQ